MADDEPLDDLRAVAMTAGAAAARVVETVVRDAQNRTQRQTQAAEDGQRRAAAQSALSAVQPASTPLPYDSPQRRSATDQAMRDAGVPDEARTAKVTADLLNGTDPRMAAAAGSARNGRPVRPLKTPERGRQR